MSDNDERQPEPFEVANALAYIVQYGPDESTTAWLCEAIRCLRSPISPPAGDAQVSDTERDAARYRYVRRWRIVRKAKSLETYASENDLDEDVDACISQLSTTPTTQKGTG